MNPLKRILKGSFLVLILSILSTALAYFTRLVLSRLLLPTDYGLIFSIFSFIGLIALFTNYGLPYAITRYIAKLRAEKKELKKVIGTTLPVIVVFSILLGFGIFLGSDWIASSFFHNPKASPLLKISSVFLICSSFSSVFNSGLAGFKQVEKFKALYTLRKGLDIFIISLLTLGFGVLGSFLGYTISLLIATLLSFFLLLRIFPNLIKLKFSSDFLKELLRFSMPAWITQISNYGLIRASILLLTFLTSTAIVGRYQTALPTSRAFWSLARSVSVMSFPIFSELFAREDKERIVSTLRFLLKWVFLLTIPAVGILFVFSRPAIVILFSSKYADAASALKVLSLSILPTSFVMVLKTVVNSSGRTKESMKVFLVGAVVNVGLCLALIPFVGMIGAALSLLVAYLLMFGLFVWLTRKITEVKVPYRAWGKGMIITGLMVIALTLLKGSIEPLLLQVIVLALLGLGIYLIGLVLIKVFSERDKRLLRSLAQKARAPRKIVEFVDRL